MLLSLPGKADISSGLKALLCLMWPETDSGRKFSPTGSIGQVLLAKSYTEKNNMPTKNSVEAAKEAGKSFLSFFVRLSLE